MAAYQDFFKEGWKIRYIPDEKVLLFTLRDPKQKSNFLREKSHIETSLQVAENKSAGPASIYVKLDKNSQTNIYELLKSRGYKGGVGEDDAESLAKDEVEDAAETAEAPTAGLSPPAAPGGPPVKESLSLVRFLRESGLFAPGPSGAKHKKHKRIGEYWKILEKNTGKNRHAMKTEDILNLRKEMSRKPYSSERNDALESLDKAEDYFFKRLKSEKGEQVASEFHEKYLAIDNLSQKEYSSKDGEKLDLGTEGGTMKLSDLGDIGGYEDVSYSDIDLENN